MRFILIATLCVACMSGCVSTVSVPKLIEAQNHKGFLTQELEYAGSTETYHYFDQFVLFGNATWFLGDTYDTFRVLKKEMTLPKGIEFDRKTSKGHDDKRRVKMAVKNAQSFRIGSEIFR